MGSNFDTFGFFSWGGVLDIAVVTAGSRQSLAISTLAKIRSRSWRLADLAISGYQPLTLAGLLALGGVYSLPGLRSRGCDITRTCGGLFLANS